MSTKITQHNIPEFKKKTSTKDNCGKNSFHRLIPFLKLVCLLFKTSIDLCLLSLFNPIHPFPISSLP